MKEKEFTSYYKFITAIFNLATECWVNGEGHGEWKVVNDKNYRQAKVDGSATARFSDKPKTDKDND